MVSVTKNQFDNTGSIQGNAISETLKCTNNTT